jgi:hypothetical protein
MNTQTCSNSMKKMVGFFFVLCALLFLAACSSKDKASCPIDMGMRVTINVTHGRVQEVFDQLARDPDCSITVVPYFWKHVTVHLENATVAEVLANVYPQIGCRWIYNQGHLTIRPTTVIDKMKDKYWEDFNSGMAERNRVLQSRLPDEMSFENAKLSRVLKEISKVTGLVIKPWEGEGDRSVTLDVSGMTVEEALTAIVYSIDGEGAVLIKPTWGFMQPYGQYWVVDAQ